MRLLTIASLSLVAACQNRVTPGDDADLARGADLAATADAAQPVPDLTGAVDLEPAPDLVAGPDMAPEADMAKPPNNGVCGGKQGLPCPGAQFCDYPMGCLGVDELGTCRNKPQACPDVYAPVCGCDGMMYGNDCERQAAGASLRHHGACGCVEPCGVGQYCTQCRGAGFVCLQNGVVC